MSGSNNGMQQSAVCLAHPFQHVGAVQPHPWSKLTFLDAAVFIIKTELSASMYMPLKYKSHSTSYWPGMETTAMLMSTALQCKCLFFQSKH